MLPIVAASLYLVFDKILTLKAQIDREAEGVAQNIAVAIDEKIDTQIAALQILATSSFANDPSRLPEFYSEAKSFQRKLGTDLVFADLSMQMLFNTRVPFGEPLPPLPRPRGHAAVPKVIETGQPAVGDMFYGPVADQNLVAVAVPVERDSTVQYVLLSVVETRQFQGLLGSLFLPQGWAVALHDGKNEVIARRQPTNLQFDAGHDSSAALFAKSSEIAPWSVTVYVPRAIYNESLYTASLILGIGLLVVTLVGFLAGSAIGRRLAGAISSLGASSPGIQSSDITEIEQVRQRITEAARAREAAEAKKRQAERHFRATFEQAAVGIAHVAPDGSFFRVNEKYCQITGYTQAELLQSSFQKITHPDDLERDLKHLKILFLGQARSNSVEKRYIRPDGEIVWVNITRFVVWTPDGEPEYLVSVSEDITERRALENQLVQAQKMESIGQLSGGLAHDLNNVLNIFSINAGILEAVLPNNSHVSQHVETTNQAVKRANALLRKLLDFSRTDLGARETVSINRFIQGMETLIAKSLTPAISLKLELPEEVWTVDIDPADFEASLLNLVLNARDAMPGGGTLVIETANKTIDQDYVDRNPTSSAGDFVMISVSDTGTGMTPEQVNRAFEPFFTTKEAGKGTGLGLSMVYGFVKRSRGHVKIYSEPGHGTAIHLFLPRSRQTDVAVDQQPSDHAGPLPRGKETILIVDDEEALVDASTATLERLGYRTLRASNGNEALEFFRQEQSIHLLLSDVIMPGGMDGYRLAFKALELRPDLKILLTSGFTPKREMFLNGEEQLASNLARNLLHKPYNVAELAFAVRQRLDDDL